VSAQTHPARTCPAPHPRRWWQGVAVGLLAVAAGTWAQPAKTLREVVLATPGPGSAVSLVPELAVRIGADRAEGLALRLSLVSGGGVAIRELNNGNAQFAVFGLPAAMNENLAGPHLVALAALEQQTLLSLMVRADLKPTVRRVEDLRGHVLGIHSNSLNSATTGQQFLALVLRQHQVPPESVQFIAAGQTWESQSAALQGKVADAIVSEEPFGLRLEQAGLAFALTRIGHAGDPHTLPGAGFLRGTLVARRQLVDADPALAEHMVKTMLRTLQWLRQHSPDEVVNTLGLAGAERQAFVAMLKDNPQQFSPDGKFSQAQLLETARFFRESAGHSPPTMAYSVQTMVVDRWVGRKP